MMEKRRDVKATTTRQQENTTVKPTPTRRRSVATATGRRLNGSTDTDFCWNWTALRAAVSFNAELFANARQMRNFDASKCQESETFPVLPFG
jgi:hypothetical protein